MSTLDELQRSAARALAEGKTIDEVAKTADRSVRTILVWAAEPEFQAIVLRGIKASALLTLAAYVNGEVEPKQGQAALAIMKWMGVAKKPGRAPSRPGREDEETDLPEFTKEQYERLEGENE